MDLCAFLWDKRSRKITLAIVVGIAPITTGWRTDWRHLPIESSIVPITIGAPSKGMFSASEPCWAILQFPILTWINIKFFPSILFVEKIVFEPYRLRVRVPLCRG